MKSLTAFSHMLIQDMGERCGVSTIRDCKTVSDRVEHEGLSFLTITLPAFGKSFERCLELGQVGDDQFLGFSRGPGGLPRFLGGFLRRVFDAGSGVLLQDPDPQAVLAVRQITLAFGKVLVPCSEERVAAAYRSYLECENEVRRNTETSLFDFRRVARTLFGPVFDEVEALVDSASLIPKHGPGVTADRLLGNEKYTVKQWPSRLEPYMPAGEYLLPNWRYWEELQGVDFVEPGDELPVKVISVPKTLKTPRIIAVEPTCMQYAQQAISRELVKRLERDDLLSPLIGFTDQLPNRELAREGSLTGALATLDLSEASDRVSNRHVIALFAAHGVLSGAVQGCRTTKADVPGHGVIPLSKFASMGSALTFPVEAMVFLTIIALAWEQSLGRPITRRDVKSMAGQVRVYGDDLIVPSTLAPAVTRHLEAHGLKVNLAKSFLNGSFRESCGGDYFRGVRVTPVRVRRLFPTSLQSAESVVSTVSLRNQLFELHAPRAVGYLDRILTRILPVYPEIPLHHTALGRWTYEPVQPARMCKRLHKPLIKAYRVHAPLPVRPVEGYPALVKYFVERGVEPLAHDAFERSGRPRAVYIKLAWLPLHRGGELA